MSYFFNSDFEDYLASSNTQYKINSNKRNQELEYFILWLEQEALYSTKQYDVTYLDFIRKFKAIKISSEVKLAKLWCSEDWNKEIQKSQNSKVSSTQFAIDNNLCHKETKIINSFEEIDSDKYIYKDAFGVSGIGTWTLNKVPKNVQFPIIKDPLLNRTFDFSTLIDGGNDTIYQNHIDEFFQYKGTTVGMSFEFFDWYEEYLSNISKIKKQYDHIRGPWSIDSFLYKEDGQEKLYSLSEINARKTMGYITLKLKKLLFADFKYARLRLISNKQIDKNFSHEAIYKNFENKIITLSPMGNMFSAFLIAEDSLGELNELEDELFLALFN